MCDIYTPVVQENLVKYDFYAVNKLQPKKNESLGIENSEFDFGGYFDDLLGKLPYKKDKIEGFRIKQEDLPYGKRTKIYTPRDWSEQQLSFANIPFLDIYRESSEGVTQVIINVMCADKENPAENPKTLRLIKIDNEWVLQNSSGKYVKPRGFSRFKEELYMNRSSIDVNNVRIKTVSDYYQYANIKNYLELLGSLSKNAPLTYELFMLLNAFGGLNYKAKERYRRERSQFCVGLAALALVKCNPVVAEYANQEPNLEEEERFESMNLDELDTEYAQTAVSNEYANDGDDQMSALIAAYFEAYPLENITARRFVSVPDWLFRLHPEIKQTGAPYELTAYLPFGKRGKINVISNSNGSGTASGRMIIIPPGDGNPNYALYLKAGSAENCREVFLNGFNLWKTIYGEGGPLANPQIAQNVRFIDTNRGITINNTPQVILETPRVGEMTLQSFLSRTELSPQLRVQIIEHFYGSTIVPINARGIVINDFNLSNFTVDGVQSFIKSGNLAELKFYPIDLESVSITTTNPSWIYQLQYEQLMVRIGRRVNNPNFPMFNGLDQQLKNWASFTESYPNLGLGENVQQFRSVRIPPNAWNGWGRSLRVIFPEEIISADPGSIRWVEVATAIQDALAKNYRSAKPGELIPVDITYDGRPLHLEVLKPKVFDYFKATSGIQRIATYTNVVTTEIGKALVPLFFIGLSEQMRSALEAIGVLKSIPGNMISNISPEQVNDTLPINSPIRFSLNFLELDQDFSHLFRQAYSCLTKLLNLEMLQTSESERNSLRIVLNVSAADTYSLINSIRLLGGKNSNQLKQFLSEIIDYEEEEPKTLACRISWPSVGGLGTTSYSNMTVTRLKNEDGGTLYQLNIIDENNQHPVVRFTVQGGQIILQNLNGEEINASGFVCDTSNSPNVNLQHMGPYTARLEGNFLIIECNKNV